MRQYPEFQFREYESIIVMKDSRTAELVQGVRGREKFRAAAVRKIRRDAHQKLNAAPIQKPLKLLVVLREDNIPGIPASTPHSDLFVVHPHISLSRLAQRAMSHVAMWADRTSTIRVFIMSNGEMSVYDKKNTVQYQLVSANNQHRSLRVRRGHAARAQAGGSVPDEEGASHAVPLRQRHGQLRLLRPTYFHQLAGGTRDSIRQPEGLSKIASAAALHDRHASSHLPLRQRNHSGAHGRTPGRAA